MEKNLTTGNIFKTIVYFALPYLLSYFLQTLYGMADLFIIGQFDHVDAITAVSNGSQVMHMLTVIIVGLAMGATVTISRAVGADRKLDAARAIGNTVTLFMAVSILFTLLLLLLVRPIVVLIGIPTEAVTGTTQYLIICCIGYSVALVIPKLPCILWPLPVLPILYWITFSLAFSIWDHPEQPLEPHLPKLSV